MHRGSVLRNLEALSLLSAFPPPSSTQNKHEYRLNTSISYTSEVALEVLSAVAADAQQFIYISKFQSLNANMVLAPQMPLHHSRGS